MWEHKFRAANHDVLQACLDEMQKENWELVSACIVIQPRKDPLHHARYSLFFKRPKQKSIEEENEARRILGLPPL